MNKSSRGWVWGVVSVFGFSFTAYAADPVPFISLKREFTALGPAYLTPQMALREMQKLRGGVDAPRPSKKTPGQWVLEDPAGFEWKAETDQESSLGVVMELKPPHLVAGQEDLLVMPLQVFGILGMKPYYSVGGGHIHIDLSRFKKHPQKYSIDQHPRVFAALVNTLLNYEELLDYIFQNPRRVHTTQKLSELRLPDGSMSMSQYLGTLLNSLLALPSDAECPAEFTKYKTTIQPDCLMGGLEYYAREVVPIRETDINLKSWKGASEKKTHGTLELRFFNAPKTANEALLEDQLVRAIVRYAVENGEAGVSYAPIAPEGERRYHNDAVLAADFKELLNKIGLNEKPYFETYLQDLRTRRHPSS